MRATLVILAICSLSLSGCGSFSDAMCGPITDHTYYRGVRFDVMAAQEGGTHTFMAADIPLSAIVDTVLLPYLAYRELTALPRGSLQSMTEQQEKSEPCKPAPAPQLTISSPQ
jgi:uncharacterized protein YceK